MSTNQLKEHLSSKNNLLLIYFFIYKVAIKLKMKFMAICIITKLTPTKMMSNG